MITEAIARALTLDELAQRLSDESTDPVVREFLRKIEVDGVSRESNRIDSLECDLQEAESSARHWQEEAEENEETLEKLTKGINAALEKNTTREALAAELRDLL